MTTATTTTTSEPPLPPPPGTFVSPRALVWVPLDETTATRVLREATRARVLSHVPFSALATLKILAPEESTDLVVSPFSARILDRIVRRILRDRMRQITR